jgi:hypothetical protein
MSWELILLEFFDNLSESQLYLFILEPNNLDVRSLDGYLEKILILRKVLSQVGYYIWKHRAYKGGLA